ncbi:winged helix-turn-helix transcriptional regulator [Sinomicrobium soli]|uniref:winged helix-turn-helix transcriptional regulator n=1 Tax=Sinomicrobium sp. N-1-3-6 TaxID=2219864 RepID=UPI000DCD32BE|nr:helix-turn-helix domain-containing protein [Sinomicrobium sp. N-1-3-6]RAV28636.1 transcriptional regulator [Sinomicrobium sp. N-1-3-6]
MKYNSTQCKTSLNALEDALYVIGGKWKLRIIIALRDEKSMRFNELQRKIGGISAKVLSNELKNLEENDFVERKVHIGASVIVEYQLTDYSETLGDVLKALVEWGTMHREKIVSSMT